MKVYEVGLESDSARRLEYFARASGRSASKLISDWTLERLATLQVPNPPEMPAAPAPLDAREILRARYRPEDVVVLMVGESAPAGETFFYQADSHLFFATREAFGRALGNVPDGDDFLRKFQEMGFWLYDLVEDPVNRKRGRPRRDAVAAGVPALAAVIQDLEPDFVIAVKTSLEGNVRQAARWADFPASRVVVLPFPLYQWREEYVSHLAGFLEPALRAGEGVPPSPNTGTRLTLHAAMRTVLETGGGGPMPARRIANEVASQGLYVRGDGAGADYQQILARARKYPNLFTVTREGISLRNEPKDPVR